MDGGSLKKSFVRLELNGDVDAPKTPSRALEVMQFSALAYLSRNEVWERLSDAVQAYARVRAEQGKRRGLPSPEFSLNARIPPLPNCVQEGDFNLASTALENCTTSLGGGQQGQRG